MKEPKEMQEIHDIMEKLYEKHKNMSDNEVLKDIHNSSEQLIKKYGLNLTRSEKKVLAFAP